jgi:hypothetical protein
MGSHLSAKQNADIGRITVQGHLEQNFARPHLNQINLHIVAGTCKQAQLHGKQKVYIRRITVHTCPSKKVRDIFMKILKVKINKVVNK